MEPIYRIEWKMHNQYAVYYRDDIASNNTLFSGSLPEVEAWISLKEKGYSF